MPPSNYNNVASSIHQFQGLLPPRSKLQASGMSSSILPLLIARAITLKGLSPTETNDSPSPVCGNDMLSTHPTARTDTPIMGTEHGRQTTIDRTHKLHPSRPLLFLVFFLFVGVPKLMRNVSTCKLDIFLYHLFDYWR